MNNGEWQHAAVVYDGGMLSLYLNGQLENSEARTLESSDGDLLLGISKDLASYAFTGALDEVRIWDTARSQSEIQAYMNRTLDGDESGLLAYYDFDEPAGSSATSLSDIAGSNHGTLYGNPSWVSSTVPMD